MTWAPDYATPGELKTDLGISDLVDDAKIGRVITAASRAVDQATHRQFGVVDAPEARLYTARWDSYRGRWIVPIDDLMTQAGLTVSVEAGAITGFALQPVNAVVKGKPWTALVVDSDSAVKPGAGSSGVSGPDIDGVTVTATFGWSAVPVTVKEATLLQASRFFKRKDAPFGVAGSPELGSEMRLLAKVDPDVAVMLRPYMRWDRKRHVG